MVGIINKIYTYISPKKERHPVHDILGTNLYNEAKAIVEEKLTLPTMYWKNLKYWSLVWIHKGLSIN